MLRIPAPLIGALGVSELKAACDSSTGSGSFKTLALVASGGLR